MVWYQLIRADQIVRQEQGSPGHGGGTLMFIRNDLAIVSKNYSISNKNIEILVVTVKPNEQRQYCLLLVYQLPSGYYKQFLLQAWF